MKQYIKKSACVVGASGLIGSLLVKELLQFHYFDKVIILVRKLLPIQHIKLEQHVVDFTSAKSIQTAIGSGNTLFICIGTTQNKVKGNKDLYKQIDVDIPALVANLAAKNGYTTVGFISAVGASVQAANFYLQIKGFAETAVINAGFINTHIYRPSLLLGKREEQRIREKIAQLLMPFISFLLVGKLAKYKPIQAVTIAKAMLYNAIHVNAGLTIYEYTAIQKAAKQ